ncbi:heme-binding protein soul2 [Acanthopagrus latus]|uniref:heme-binding protein soul2 n=1 Tax=Acanthopagrus latus TaxID=8177 RepID=UPI00187C97C9|nr:heme-binding protein soul2 [Acanthopagrus latus]
MARQLALALFLFLVSVCTARAWLAPDFCHEKQCPEYKLIKKGKGYEERLYDAAQWITTKVESDESIDLMAANSRLKAYCKKQNDDGYNIPEDTWPVVITVRRGKDYYLSWFVPPGTKTPPPESDPLVTIESRPEATVYVRVFGGIPSIKGGEENAKALCKSLDKDCTDTTYCGAGYESFFSPSHHNEIWIYASDINKSETS